ncbi:hypothetical protein GSB9_01708 [Flavobacteriaceae bacterium GSB9]|nr:hypothetical protein GSB9_01708 [Flavobacteriaceae bacterium GSB9]
MKYDISEQAYKETEIIDSVSVVGTENILGITYFKFKTKTTGSTDSGTPYSNPNGIKFDYFREVDGNLVNENNEIIFTTTDYTEHTIIEATWGSIFQKLAEDLSTIKVPSGTFLCYNKQQYARTPDGEQLPSMDNYYYAEGVGLIQDSVSLIALDTPVMIRQLFSYNVN